MIFIIKAHEKNAKKPMYLKDVGTLCCSIEEAKEFKSFEEAGVIAELSKANYKWMAPLEISILRVIEK